MIQSRDKLFNYLVAIKIYILFSYYLPNFELILYKNKILFEKS